MKKKFLFWKYNGIFIALFDKLILAVLAMQAFITYLGIKTEFYSNNESKIFYIILFINIVISEVLSAIHVILFETGSFGFFLLFRWFKN